MKELEMNWIFNQFERRRANDEIIRMARALAPEVLRRMPADQPIDAQKLKRDTIALAATLVAGFQENDLL